MTDKHFEKQVIKILRSVAVGAKGTEIAVVRWITDGTAYSPQLINQEVYFDRVEKKVKYGKMKGLKYGDWQLIMKHRDEIETLLKDLGDRPDTQSRAANDVPAAQAPAPGDAQEYADDEIAF